MLFTLSGFYRFLEGEGALCRESPFSTGRNGRLKSVERFI